MRHPACDTKRTSHQHEDECAVGLKLARPESSVFLHVEIPEEQGIYRETKETRGFENIRIHGSQLSFCLQVQQHDRQPAESSPPHDEGAPQGSSGACAVRYYRTSVKPSIR